MASAAHAWLAFTTSRRGCGTGTCIAREGTFPARSTRRALPGNFLDFVHSVRCSRSQVVLGAGDAGQLVSKLYRLAAASLQPDALVIPLLARDPAALVTFTFELASYRLFMDRLLAGNGSPRELAEAVEREQRNWLRGLIARFRQPADLLPDTTEDAP